MTICSTHFMFYFTVWWPIRCGVISTQDDQSKYAFIAQIWLLCSQTWKREKKNPPSHLSSITMLVPTMNIKTKSCVSVSIYIQDAKTFYLH